MILLNINNLSFKTAHLRDYLYTLRAGEKIYRISPGNPLIATGRGTSFTTQPIDQVSWKGNTALGSAIFYTAGSGALFGAKHPQTAEIEKIKNEPLDHQILWELALKENLSLLDVDRLCQSQGIGKPYRTNNEEPILQEFYGECLDAKIPGLFIESRENPIDHTVIIYTDFLLNFEESVLVREIKRY